MRTKPDLPLVSVIIPTHNRSRLLREAVESALAQTYSHVEVIVVDDGSTDDTAALMASYDGRVTYIRQANQGVAAARNAGYRAASGAYLTFLDDDDLFLPQKIERQVQMLNAQPRSGLVHCRFYYADEDGKILRKAGKRPEGDVLHQLMGGNLLWEGAPLVRRSCLERVGLFDERISAITADWDMWLRIAQAGYRFGCVQEPLGVYRIHRNSLMSNVAEVERATLAVLEGAFSHPHLPADVLASKRQALTHCHLWIGCLYYAAGQWADGQRNLAAALDLSPQLLRQPDRICQLLSGLALNERVQDPLRFMANVLDHLPACAYDLRRYRPKILSRIYTQLAMRSFCAGHIAQARSQFSEAIDLDPGIPARAAAFARSLAYAALHLPVSDPVLYVNRVLGNLPPQARHLRHVRERVLSDIHVKLAHQDRLAGQRWPAFRHILTAALYHPFSVRNWKLVLISLKSLLSGLG